MEILSLSSPSQKPNQSQNKTITDLRPGVRDANRVNVFVDGKFSFSLDVAQVVELGVRKGLVLSDERLAELREASEFGKLFQRTLEWVLTRPHSVRETRDYLKRRQSKRRQDNRLREQNREKKTRLKAEGFRAREGSFDPMKLPTKILPEFPDEMLELVVARLTERGYLDDERFAEYYIENRNARKGSSLRKLRLELAQKGVAAEIVDRVLASGERNDAEEIRKIIAKKQRKYDDEKLVAYLVRQGFDYYTAREAVENYSSI